MSLFGRFKIPRGRGNFTADLEGVRELGRNFERLSYFTSNRDMIDNVYKVAKEIQSDVKGRAPVGKTGNLRNSIKAEIFKNPPKFKEASKGYAFVAVDRGRKGGNHAYLVEFGTTARRQPKTAKMLVFEGSGGETIFAKSVAPMPSHPFFRPTIESWRGSKYLNAMKEATADALKNVTNKMEITR